MIKGFTTLSGVVHLGNCSLNVLFVSLYLR